MLFFVSEGPFVQFMVQGPVPLVWVPSKLLPEGGTTLNPLAQAPLSQFPLLVPHTLSLHTDSLRPADSTTNTVLLRPSLMSVIRRVLLYGKLIEDPIQP